MTDATSATANVALDDAIRDASAEVAKYGHTSTDSSTRRTTCLMWLRTRTHRVAGLKTLTMLRRLSELGKDSNHCTGGNCDARPGESDQADSVWHCCSSGVRNGGPDWNEIDSNYLI